MLSQKSVPNCTNSMIKWRVCVRTYICIEKGWGQYQKKVILSFDGISSYTSLHITLKYQKKLFLDVRIKENCFPFLGGGDEF